MRKQTLLNIEQLKVLKANEFICTSVKVMKYLTLECKINYIDLVITADGWTCWIFKECNTLSRALKNRSNSILA